MATFRNLKDIQKYLEQNAEVILDSSMQIEGYLAERMSAAVVEHVYNVFEPSQYDRRESRGGLSDVRNMAITDVSVVGGAVKVTFENLTEGFDNLNGEYISDLIEFGQGHAGKTWNEPDGIWAKPRPFSAKAAEEIIANPGTLIKLIKSELGTAGFKVK